jgi:hypothetical protein
MFEGWWKDAKEMIFLLKNLKIVVSAFLIANLLNTQAFAQVSSNPMRCNDPERNINYSAHFKGNEVLLVLRGFTHRVPYTRSFVDPRGVRWSVYENREIAVYTTLPYNKYVGISGLPYDTPIAGTLCD